MKKKTFPANRASLHMAGQHIVLLRTGSILVFQQRYRLLFSIIILITQTYKTKKILQAPGTILYFQYLEKGKK